MRRRLSVTGLLITLLVVATACPPNPGSIPIAENGMITYEVREDGVVTDSVQGPAGIDTGRVISTWQEGNWTLRVVATYMNTWPPFDGLEGQYRFDETTRTENCMWCGSGTDEVTVHAPGGQSFRIVDPVVEIGPAPWDGCEYGDLWLRTWSGPVEGMPGVELTFGFGTCNDD